MRVSQKQIAEALSLSTITVSRALRNHPYLAETTKERVLAKAQEMGYFKGQTPQESTDTPRRAGILFYESPGQRENPLLSGAKHFIFHALQRECQNLNAETLFESCQPDTMPKLVQNRTIDMAFLFGNFTHASVKHLSSIPTLAVSSFIDSPSLPRVVANNIGGMCEATEHLISLGHRRIIFLSEADRQLFRERAGGYQIAMHRHNLQPVTLLFSNQEQLRTESLVISPNRSLSPEVLVRKLEGYTGIVCASDSQAYWVQKVLHSAGKRTPEDCSIVSFDNLADEYPFTSHKITSYSPDWEQMGRIAASLLLSHPINIKGQDVQITTQGRLVHHQSTGPVPV